MSITPYFRYRFFCAYNINYEMHVIYIYDMFSCMVLLEGTRNLRTSTAHIGRFLVLKSLPMKNENRVCAQRYYLSSLLQNYTINCLYIYLDFFFEWGVKRWKKSSLVINQNVFCCARTSLPRLYSCLSFPRKNKYNF